MYIQCMCVYNACVCICPSFVFAERDFCGFKEIQLTLLKDFTFLNTQPALTLQD